MVKKLFLSLASGLLLFISASGKEIPQFPQQSNTSLLFSDTLLNKDSAIVNTGKTLKNPKEDFKNLFNYASNDGSSFQLNPKVQSFVEDYMAKHANNLEKMKDWGRPYFNMMDEIFLLHGLPVELKYLSVIESMLKNNAVSWAGAVGPWQFMPSTARNMGLKVSKYKDERRDYYKSTHAAAKYLTQLYNIYEDWLLVIAAYNCGPGGVNNAIRRSGSRDFYQLQYNLPTETRNHVKKFIATHHIMEGDGGLTTLTKFEIKDRNFNTGIISTEDNLLAKVQELPGTKKLTLSGKYNSMVIAKQIAYDIADFNKLNPDFDQVMANAGNYDMRLPADMMDKFLANKYQILNESLQLLLHAANNSTISQPTGKVSGKAIR